MPQAIQRLQADAKQGAKNTLKLTNELAQYQAAELIVLTPVKDGLRMIQLQLTAANQVDASYAKMLASKIAAQSKQTIAILGWNPADLLHRRRWYCREAAILRSTAEPCCELR